MVYCGKPSRGCQMCRMRRIKCDETKPSCNQCAKSRRQCPGYKDEFDLMFRNETRATEKRAQRASKKILSQTARKQGAESSTSARVPLPTTTNTTTITTTRSPFELAVIPAIQIPTETQASCHFVSNFVLLPRQGSTRGFMDYLIPVMKNDPGASHLQFAFNACALASLGNRVNSIGIDFPERSFAEYVKALQATNAAVRDPKKSKSDSLLAAVLLLSMFENITATKNGEYAWGSHIDGAIQLARARGPKQLKSKVGLQLFIAVRIQLIIHALSSGEAPPMGVDWWFGDAINDRVAAHCQRLNLLTAALRAEVTTVMTKVSRTPDNVALILGLMRRAQALDADLAAWMAGLPDGWQYKPVCWQDADASSSAEAFPGRVDVYHDFWIASVWNLARTARLILMSLTVRCAAWAVAPVDYRTTPEYATAARTAMDTIADILASVPYHLGWHAKKQRGGAGEEEEGFGGGEFACGEDHSMKGLAGYFLTWPLGCVMIQDYLTDAQRRWVVGRLKYIADDLGVKYAHILTQLQVRVPSMLIRRDAMMVQPYAMSHNFEKLLSDARRAAPAAGYAMNPLQQREAMQKQVYEQQRIELITRVTGAGVEETAQTVAKKWLSVS